MKRILVIAWALAFALVTSGIAAGASRPSTNSGPRMQVKGSQKSGKRTAPSSRVRSEGKAKKASGSDGASHPNKKSKTNHQGRAEFMKATGYPDGRDGYEVDYIVPLECGGADQPANMQWLSTEEFKARKMAGIRCPDASASRPAAPQS